MCSNAWVQCSKKCIFCENESRKWVHAEQSISFLERVPVYDHAPARELSDDFDALFAPFCSKLAARVFAPDGAHPFGVMHRQAKTGDRELLLINVRSEPTSIVLRGRNGSPVDGYDMLNEEAVNGSGIELPFQGVRLIRISS